MLKLAKGGCCFNRRYLIVKDGQITYYRDAPHSLNLVSLKSDLSSTPKGQISARLCRFRQIDSNLFTKKTHRYLIEISFISPSKKGKRIFWVFATHSQALCDNWVKSMESEKNFDSSKDEKAKKAQKALEEKIIDEMNKRKMREEAFRKVNEFEKRKQRLKEQRIEEENRKKEVENERKRLHEQQEKKKMEELEINKRKRYEKLLKFSWDYKFQALWSKSLKAASFEDSLTNGIRLFKHLGAFRAKVLEISRLIVNEITLPDHDKRIFPLEESDSYQTYEYQNIVLKLTPRNSRSPDWETLGHEFRANNWLCDLAYSLGKNSSQFPLRVPLMCLVDYRGFRVLATAKVPIEGDRTLIHGPKHDGVYVAEHNLYGPLQEISCKAGLKEHSFEWNARVGPCYVHLTGFCELHRTFGYNELETYVSQSLGTENFASVKTDEYVYMMNLAFIFPVDKFSSSQLDFTKRLRPEFVEKYQERLNPDCFISKHTSIEADNRALVKASQYLQSRQVELLTAGLDSLECFVTDSKSMQQVFHAHGVNLRYMGRVADKSKLTHIKQMIAVECLARSCKVLLFQLLSEFNLDYSKVVDDGDMSARTMSYVPSPLPREDLHKASRQSIHTVFTPSIKKRVHRKTTTSIAFDDPENLFEEILAFNTFTLESYMSSKIADFLNLVFGSKSQSDYFWKQAILTTAWSKFGIDGEIMRKSSVNLNALLFAVCYHCNLRIDFKADLDLNQEDPFNREMVKVVEAKCRSYELAQVECRALADSMRECVEKQKYALALQACELRLRISSALNKENEHGDPLTLTDLGEILTETNELDTAIKKAKESLLQMHPYSISSIRNWCILVKSFLKKNLQVEAIDCFKAALQALEFHYHSFHPLHIKLHQFISEIYLSQKDLQSASSFIKTALASSLKMLGPTHRFTAQIYVDIGKILSFEGRHERVFEYYEKAFNVFSSIYSEKHLVTLACGLLLGECCERLGKYDRAVDLLGLVCKSFDKVIARGVAGKTSNTGKSNQRKNFDVEGIREKQEGLIKAGIKDDLKDLSQKLYSAALIGVKASLKINRAESILFFCDQVIRSSSILQLPNEEISKYCLKNSLEVLMDKLSVKVKSLISKKVFASRPGSTDLKGIMNEIKEFDSLSAFLLYHLNWMQKTSEPESSQHQVLRSTELIRVIFMLN